MKPTRQIASFLSAIPKNINAVLLHGNDLGLISERARLCCTYLLTLMSVFGDAD